MIYKYIYDCFVAHNAILIFQDVMLLCCYVVMPSFLRIIKSHYPLERYYQVETKKKREGVPTYGTGNI